MLYFVENFSHRVEKFNNVSSTFYDKMVYSEFLGFVVNLTITNFASKYPGTRFLWNIKFTHLLFSMPYFKAY